MKRGTGVEVGCLKALEKPMADLEESMKGFVKEAVEGEGELRRLQVEAMEAKAELTHCKQELEQSRNNFLSEAAETRILNSKLKELEAELAEAKGHVEEAAQRGGVRFLQQVKQVEGRGLISLDLSKCVLEIKKGMDFKAKKPTEAPVAQFTDESLATSALADASELVSMLKGARISVESHVKPVSKGADAFWEQLAEGRAELIRQHLAAKAEDAEIAAKGVPNRQGTNAVVVKIGLPSEK
ncbi:unnamed protein product [Effrenium voratum]|nr:unnamed protein product [Effrenium voratum]